MINEIDIRLALMGTSILLLAIVMLYQNKKIRKLEEYAQLK